MTLPTCSSAMSSSSEDSGALVSKPTISSCPRRCSAETASNVCSAQLAGADSLAEGDDDGVVERGGVEDDAPGSPPEHPATATSTPPTTSAVRARRAGVAGEVTRRRYVTGHAAAEPAAEPAG